MISIVTCSIDDRRFAAAEAGWARVLTGEEYELIRVPDARSMCEGYTRGFARSRGETVIFAHDDIDILCTDFPRRLREHMGRCDLLGVAGTRKLAGPSWSWAGPPHVYGQVAQWRAQDNAFDLAIFNAAAPFIGQMQALDGVFLATTRAVVERIGFDVATFAGFHHYDLDFTYRAFEAGLRLGVCCDLDFVHNSYGQWDDGWKRSAQMFASKFAGRIKFEPAVQWRRTGVLAKTREELIHRMHPPHWDQ